ncbi:titin-like [Ruditapes philippinarum]|uniref:titin-like n=1 Tax=Ruditapes philippinarum TaxID=129788 RepID=UPI00295A9C18|nr:titin-like [Ruditapes philippinarum]
MSCILLPFYFVGFALVRGYSRECDYNRTIFAPEGTTVTFLYNNTDILKHRLSIIRTSGSTTGYLYSANVADAPKIRTYYYDVSWKYRSNISFHSGSNDQFILKIDLNNVRMEDNGTYLISNGRDNDCYILYVMRTRIQPSHSQEENEPIYVFAHPQASLIKRPLTNATMVWLLDGKSDKETASFIEQGDLMWIPSLRKSLNERNVTYRAIQDDGRITEVNTTITVKYGPSHSLMLVPRKTHYNLVSGDIMPNITCTPECNPPCKISWGEHSKGKTLSLGSVKNKDSGEYTCTASRIGGQTVQQTVSIFVADRPLQSLKLSPRKTLYNLVSGDAMPDITCTSECNPPCTISWGQDSKDNILSLGAVTTEDTGEYTCTARRLDGRTVEQTVNVFVSDNSYFAIAIICLATVQSLTIIALGLCTFFIYKRKVLFCCQQLSEFVSKNKTDNTTVSIPQSNVQGSENRVYEDLKHGTRNNVYGEVILSTIGDDATVSTYENMSIPERNKAVAEN